MGSQPPRPTFDRSPSLNRRKPLNCIQLGEAATPYFLGCFDHAETDRVDPAHQPWLSSNNAQPTSELARTLILPIALRHLRIAKLHQWLDPAAVWAGGGARLAAAVLAHHPAAQPSACRRDRRRSSRRLDDRAAAETLSEYREQDRRAYERPCSMTRPRPQSNRSAIANEKEIGRLGSCSLPLPRYSQAPHGALANPLTLLPNLTTTRLSHGLAVIQRPILTPVV